MEEQDEKHVPASAAEHDHEHENDESYSLEEEGAIGNPLNEEVLRLSHKHVARMSSHSEVLYES